MSGSNRKDRRAAEACARKNKSKDQRDPEKLAQIMEDRGKLVLLDILIDGCEQQDQEATITFGDLHGMYEQLKKDLVEAAGQDSKPEEEEEESRIITLN